MLCFTDLQVKKLPRVSDLFILFMLNRYYTFVLCKSKLVRQIGSSCEKEDELITGFTMIMQDCL